MVKLMDFLTITHFPFIFFKFFIKFIFIKLIFFNLAFIVNGNLIFIRLLNFILINY